MHTFVAELFHLGAEDTAQHNNPFNYVSSKVFFLAAGFKIFFLSAHALCSPKETFLARGCTNECRVTF